MSVEMAQPDVLWSGEKGRDFLADIRTFAASLDDYQIVFDALDDRGKFVYVEAGTYSLRRDGGLGAFACPECGHAEFDVMEGWLDEKAVLGLLCLGCETYGILIPDGL